MSDNQLILRLAKVLQAKMEEVNDLLRQQIEDYEATHEALTQEQDEPGSE